MYTFVNGSLFLEKGNMNMKNRALSTLPLLYHREYCMNLYLPFESSESVEFS